MKDREDFAAANEALRISLALLQGRFADLAAAFARIAPAEAEAAVVALEHDLARAITKLKQEVSERVGGNADHILAPAATGLRDAIVLAKERMKEAAKPH